MRKCLEAVNLIFTRNFAFSPKQRKAPSSASSSGSTASAPAGGAPPPRAAASRPRGGSVLYRPAPASSHEARQRELRREYDEEQAVLLAKVRAERRFQERLALLHARHSSRQLSGQLADNGEATPIAPEKLQALCQRVFHFDSQSGTRTFATLQALQGKKLELAPATAHVYAVLRQKAHPLTAMVLEGRRDIVQKHYTTAVKAEASMFDAGSDARDFLLAVRQLVIDVRARMCEAYPELLDPATDVTPKRASEATDSAEKRQTSLFAAVRRG